MNELEQLKKICKSVSYCQHCKVATLGEDDRNAECPLTDLTPSSWDIAEIIERMGIVACEKSCMNCRDHIVNTSCGVTTDYCRSLNMKQSFMIPDMDFYCKFWEEK